MPVSISALICDDIRLEMNGKMFMIGAYIESMSVPSFPSESVFDCIVRFSGLPSDAKYMDLTIKHIGYAAETTRFDFPYVTDGCANIVIMQFPFKAKRSGNFSLHASVDGGRRRRIETLSISADSSEAEAV